MRELTITSGRNMAHIDPSLTIWGWEVPVYLFLGGLVAGLLFFSAWHYLRGNQEAMPTTVARAALLAPVLLAAGLFALFLDLEYKSHVYRFYTAIKLESPMSWGSWTLAIVMPLSLLWALLHWRAATGIALPQWPLLDRSLVLLRQYGNWLAMVLMVSAVVLGMYTGILLSAFNARPAWNSAILGPLFLASGLSAGLALNLLFSRETKELHLLGKTDLIVIGIELFLIVHLFMGFLASTQVHIDAAQLFLGGPYTAAFWIFVVLAGLVLPAILEGLALTGRIKESRIPAILVLAGSFAMRYIIVEAGQYSAWSY